MRTTLLVLATLAVLGSLSPRWTLTELARVESESVDGRYQINAAMALTVGPNGNVYVADRSPYRILVFDSTGRYLFQIGRDGDGPGEFRSISWIGFHRDTLYTIDNRLRRASLFSAGGRLLNSIALTPPRTSPLPEILSVAMDGTALWVSRVPPTIRRDSLVPLPIVAVRQGIVDTLTMVHRSNGMAQFDAGGYPVFTGQPILDDPLIVAAADGSRIVVIGRQAPATDSKNAVYSVEAFSSDRRRLFERSIAYEPRALAPSVFDSLVAVVMDRPPRAFSAKIVAAALYHPRFLPPVSGAIIGREGQVFAEREKIGQARIVCDVIDSTGTPIGTMEYAADGTLLYANASSVWMRRSHQDGRIYLVRYGIGRT